MHPIVSILTTCYNREAYLAECIESVLNGHFQDFELIIVDDQSTDGSLDIAKNYAAQDERIKVHRNEVNLGDYPNRNRAASLAKGKYIKYLDADDMLGKWALDIMVDAVEQFPNAGFALFDFGPNRPLYPVELSPEQAFEGYYSGRYDFFHRSPLSSIIKRSALDAVKGFSGSQFVGDFEMWHRLCSQFPLVIISHSPVFWREHEAQESELIRQDPVIPLSYLQLSETILASEACPFQGEAQQYHIQKARRKTARSIFYGFKRHGFAGALRMKRHSHKTWVQLLRDAFS